MVVVPGVPVLGTVVLVVTTPVVRADAYTKMVNLHS
jgi:hypothetical protein